MTLAYFPVSKHGRQGTCPGAGLGPGRTCGTVSRERSAISGCRDGCGRATPGPPNLQLKARQAPMGSTAVKFCH
jgi:hypothetical protein